VVVDEVIVSKVVGVSGSGGGEDVCYEGRAHIVSGFKNFKTQKHLRINVQEPHHCPAS
jgi:hypothetical protein